MKIVLATDGSDFSEDAARFLAHLNFSQQDEIVILYVISEIPYEDDVNAQIKRVIKRVAPKILDSASRILNQVKAKIIAIEEEGYPDTTIIGTAVQRDADLIVMGARGVKGIKLLFLGSSTRSVAINSPKPVLVVKRPGWKPGKGMKVLFATDGSVAADAAGGLLPLIPFPDETEVSIMYVAASPIADVPEKFLMEINEGLKKEEDRMKAEGLGKSEKIIEQARARLGGRFGKVTVLTKIGDPSREILNAEKMIEPDVLAVGSRGLRGVKGMLGSVSRRILGHSESSVLIGKAG